MKNTLPYVIMLLALTFAISACEKQGKMEEMGEKADQMMEDASDKMKDMNDEIKKKAKDAKEAMTN